MIVREVANQIIDRVMGTPEGIFMAIDAMIEDGEIDQDFFRHNEMGILNIVDEAMFECEACGWNVGRSDESATDSVCHDCYEGD